MVNAASPPVSSYWSVAGTDGICVLRLSETPEF